MNTPATSIGAAEVLQQLERILHSRLFEKANRSRRFLRHIVEAALHDERHVVKEYTIALEVFDRTADYDPSIDATVRVEASRLRNRLREYYADEGRDDTLIIEMPRGGYGIISSRRSDLITAASAPIAEVIAVTDTPSALAPSHAGRSLAITTDKDGEVFVVWSPATKRVLAAGVCTLLLLVALSAYLLLPRMRPAKMQYTQLTDFADSAVGPALSPDGRIVAFIRGNSSFLSPDQIYVKMLPDGEATRITNDPRLKYGPAFSPDGSQIAYTVLDSSFSTYTVSVLGGESHLFLNNAAGLTWLDPKQLLFSQIRSGQHLGIVTGTATREYFRELYFPAHERAMAHLSYASPDRRSVLVVEMNKKGAWASCRLLSLNAQAQTRSVGPDGGCTAAAWSPDGAWMYFAATVQGQSHLWRQRFPKGQPEQITFGPTEEEGVVIDKDGRSLITSLGEHESVIRIHDARGERSLSSEGEVISDSSPPSFSADGKILYYLLLQHSLRAGPELWRTVVQSGESEAVLPGISMSAYDISPDGRQVVYATETPGKPSQVWIASLSRNAPPKLIGSSGETTPYFGPGGRILFQIAEGKFNYLEQMKPDGSARSKVVTYPIGFMQGISPRRRWVMAAVPLPGGTGVAPVAIPTGGGPLRIMCTDVCSPTWSSSGKWLFIPLEAPSRTGAGRSLAIPVGDGERLPDFPPAGISPLAQASVIPGAQSINRGQLVPGADLDHFAYVNTTVHRNLYRISLP